ncbi:hypothetical protein EDC04DRAFT_1635318 [Pisolithus marmoratus]|nr:hypothetical protein EDC04DRAFT_1635318 [Pisolithus marmoratus]
MCALALLFRCVAHTNLTAIWRTPVSRAKLINACSVFLGYTPALSVHCAGVPGKKIRPSIKRPVTICVRHFTFCKYIYDLFILASVYLVSNILSSATSVDFV